MNENMYFTIKDLDDTIMSFLDPPQILSVSQLNKHYHNQTNQIRYQINDIRTNFLVACVRGNLLMAKWILRIRDKFDMQQKHRRYDRKCKCYKCTTAVSEYLRINIPTEHEDSFSPFYLACRNGQMAMAEWLFDLPYECFDEERNNPLCDFILSRKSYSESVIKWYEEFIVKKVDWSNEYFLMVACEPRPLTAAEEYLCG